ncbi:uncharacterized protein LOC143227535 [Tachypleus tridentatus]|uniref:uncharacterized protein LOC143227535 n=1 Tax=Tachypleus tridentatus TaxID=6853 RepID=UPI003FD57D2F
MADDDTHNHAHDTLVLTRSVPASCGGSARRIISNINATPESDGLSNQVQPSVEVSTADILQQAFQEASEELEQITVTYENVQNVVGIADVHSQFSRNDELAVTVGDSSNIHINRVNSQNVENGLNLVNQIVAVDGTNGVRLINSGDFLSTSNHNVQPYDLQSFIVAIPDVTDGLTDNISFVAPGLSGSSSLVSQLPDGVSVIAQGLSENSSVESLCDVSFTTVPASSIFTTCSASSRHISTISRTTSLPLPVSTSEVFSVVSQSLSGNSQTISVVPRSLAQPFSLSVTQATLPDEGLKHIQRFPVSGGLQNVFPSVSPCRKTNENSNTSAISNSTTSTGQIASVIDSTKEATVNGKIDGTSKTDPDVPSKGLYGSACTESPTVNLEPVEKPRKRVNVAKIRRQNKLKDVLRHCTDEDLLEVVFPRLAGVVSLWEFLLKKFQLEDANELEITDMFDQLTTLMTRVRALAQDCLTQASEDNSEENNKSTVKIHSKELAELLGISTGVYQTKPWKNPYQAEVLSETQSFIEPSSSQCSRETGAEATEFMLDVCKLAGDDNTLLDSVCVVDSKDKNVMVTSSLLAPVNINNASEKHITAYPSDLPSTSVSYSDSNCDVSLFEKSSENTAQFCGSRSSPPPKKRCLEDSFQIVISPDLAKSISSACSLPSGVLNNESINSDKSDSSKKDIMNTTSKTDVSIIETLTDSEGKSKTESNEIHSRLTGSNIGHQNSKIISTLPPAQFLTSVTVNGQQSDKLTTFANVAEQLSTISVKNVQLPSEVNRILSSEASVSKGSNYSKQGPEPQEDNIHEPKTHNYLRISNNNIVVISSTATNSQNSSSFEQHLTGRYSENQEIVKNSGYEKKLHITDPV